MPYCVPCFPIFHASIACTQSSVLTSSMRNSILTLYFNNILSTIRIYCNWINMALDITYNRREYYSTNDKPLKS